LGGTGQVIGTAPGGGLILAGAGNQLPDYKPPAPTPVAPTTTIGSVSSTPANIKDLIAGVSDFFAQTVKGSTINSLFSDVGVYGNSPTSSTGEGYTALQRAQDQIRSTLASLTGLPQVYGALDAKGNLDALSKSLSSGTDLNKVSDFLESLVNFRTLANHYDPKDYYAKAGITDPRLGNVSSATNNFTIQLQGSSNASADILGIVQMLGNLYGSATP